MQLLTDQERQQIRAALMLWNTLAQNSRTHPSRHPRSGSCFIREVPMSVDEIERLISQLDSTPMQQPEIKIPVICLETGWSRSQVHSILRKYKIKPMRRGVYRRFDLTPLYEEAQRAKHAAPK